MLNRLHLAHLNFEIWVLAEDREDGVLLFLHFRCLWAILHQCQEDLLRRIAGSLLPNECFYFLNRLSVGSAMRVHYRLKRHYTWKYNNFETKWGSCSALTIQNGIRLSTEVCAWNARTHLMTSSHELPVRGRCVTVLTFLKLFGEVQLLAVEDQNKIWLATPLQGGCCVQRYSCPDSEAPARVKHLKKNKKLKRGTSELTQRHSRTASSSADPLTAILVLMTGYVTLWHRCTWAWGQNNYWPV